MISYGKEAIFHHQIDMPFLDALEYLHHDLTLALSTRSVVEERAALLEARIRSRRAGDRFAGCASLPTSDRTPAAGRGVDMLAPLVGERLGREPRVIGGPSSRSGLPTTRTSRRSRGCLLRPADMSGRGLGRRHRSSLRHRVSIALTTLPALARLRPERAVSLARRRTRTPTRPLRPERLSRGGCALAGACGLSDAASHRLASPELVASPGYTTSTAADRAAFEERPVTMVGATRSRPWSAVKPLDGAPVYVHPRPRRDRPGSPRRPVPRARRPRPRPALRRARGRGRTAATGGGRGHGLRGSEVERREARGRVGGRCLGSSRLLDAAPRRPMRPLSASSVRRRQGAHPGHAGGAGRRCPPSSRTSTPAARRPGSAVRRGEDRPPAPRPRSRTARERLALLIDAGTFTELGIHGRPHFSQRRRAGPRCAGGGVVTGYAKVRRHASWPCRAYDFTGDRRSMGVTGELKVTRLRTLEVLSGADALPFQVAGTQEIPEEQRLRYRFLDLRREKIHANIVLRSKVISSLRRRMVEQGFLEYQTPILTSSSPEGAVTISSRAAFTPGSFTRCHRRRSSSSSCSWCRGSIGIFKSRLAFATRTRAPIARRASSISSISRCRSSNRTMCLGQIEPVLSGLFSEFSTGRSRSRRFRASRIDEAMTAFGTDKPDLRNPIRAIDVTELFRDSGFAVFAKAVAAGNVVRAIVAPGAAERIAQLLRQDGRTGQGIRPCRRRVSRARGSDQGPAGQVPGR